MNNGNMLSFNVIVALVLLWVAFSSVIACLGSYSCHKKAEMQGLECEWGVFQGCMVKMPSGNWMDYDRLRYMK